MFLNILQMVIKLLVAMILGGVVGWEREINDRPAGLRTHVLVAMGSALITMVSMSFQGPGLDPSRIAAQIVSGIGFLGAGAILRRGNIVRGLTTAASLWVVAAIGMAVGVGGEYAVLATFTTLVVFATLSAVNRLEHIVGTKSNHEITFDIGVKNPRGLAEITGCLVANGVSIKSMQTIDKEGSQGTTVKLVLSSSSRFPEKVLVELLESQEGVSGISWG
jgi:putative Mg2+ transporter-C (MgtC) family protein